jgi:hypothetical protein
MNPSQPLTAGVWFDNKQLNEFQLASSDVVTFHNYQPAAGLEREIVSLKLYKRPIICTEWMARTCGSLVDTNLPIFAREKVGCINWGLVSGKTNTIYQWEVMPDLVNVTTRQTGSGETMIWFHDLFGVDGTPYDQTEVDLFKKYTGRSTPLSSDASTLSRS